MKSIGRFGQKKARAVSALVAAVWLAMGITSASASDPFMKPTPEELAMKEVPGYPGAPAVILFKEAVTKDDLHVVQHYERIKILNEKGKDYANVELRFASSKGDSYFLGDDKSITDIMGRTIHADGTVIPFTGKPYLKTLENAKKYKDQARVFTLPDVEVGSIIEYRYAVRTDDHAFEAPDWYIQADIFTRAAHFAWFPTNKELTSEKGSINSITWFPLLPPGVTLKPREMPAPGGTQQVYELTVKDVPPAPSEEYMPPLRSFTYRVLFAYSPFRTAAEYWKAEGKTFSKDVDSFAGPDGSLRAATDGVIAGATTQNAKLEKIYAAVMAMENTDFTRDHGRNEDKAEGLGKVSNAGDVFKHGRGSSTQLTEMFIGMARAAGMKAYAMLVPDREYRLFTPSWLSFAQFDNMIAIVVVDGKEQFFDPGQRYCPYGHLAWQDTLVHGLRQTEGGTEFVTSPGDNYQATKTERVADLKMDERGEISGRINMTYAGYTALQWRQRALRGDEESVKLSLRDSLQEMVPKSMEVTVSSIENLKDYDKPLIVHYDAKGSLGTSTGKRLILPANVFTASASGTFPHQKRELPVYFHYPQTVLDVMRIKFPGTMAVEAAPEDTKTKFKEMGQYVLHAQKDPNSITVRRAYLFNTVIVPVEEYSDLRTFYSEFETKDKDSIVLKAGGVAGTPAGN